MADSKVIFEVVVEGKNIKVVQKQVQDLGKSVDRTTTAEQRNTTAVRQNSAALNEGATATKHYNRGQKGVAGATANGTKAFSKQRDAITGSSGLVGAYATLAANMFAATAVFNAFRGAAQVQQLREGMTALGAQSGLAMKTISAGLVEATDSAISLEQAMRSTVQITSAGLDPSSVIRFGDAARNASIALGRNLNDTIDRLTRGVTKLEPELLDELGIFIRIDEVTAEYAATVGKTTTQLTSFEKRLAFQDAALTQLEEKFSAVGEATDVNPYDRLGASFVNLGNNAAGFVAKGLTPIVKYLSESPMALVGVLTLLGGRVIKQAVQSFGAFQMAAEDQQVVFDRLSKQIEDHTSALESQSGGQIRFQQSLKDGTATIEGAEAAIKGANSSLTRYQGAATRTSNKIKQLNQDYTAGKISLKDYQAQLTKLNASMATTLAKMGLAEQRVKAFRTALGQLQQQTGLVKYEAAAAAIAQGRWNKALAAGKEGFTLQFNGLKLMKNNLTDFSSKLAFARAGMKLFTSTAKLMGVAFLAAIPMIGAVITTLILLKDAVLWVRDAFKSDEQKAFEKQLSATKDTMEELKSTFANLNGTFAVQSAYTGGLVARYEALGNAISQARDELEKLARMPGVDMEELIKQYDELLKGSRDLSLAYETVRIESAISIPTEAQRVELIKEAVERIKAGTTEMKALKSAGEAVTKEFQDLRNSARIKNELTDAANALDTFYNNINITQQRLEEMGVTAEQALAQAVEGAISSIRDEQILLQIGIDKKFLDQLKAGNKELRDAQDRLQRLQAEREKAFGGFTLPGTLQAIDAQIEVLKILVEVYKTDNTAAAEDAKEQVKNRLEIIKAAEEQLSLGKQQIATQDQQIALLKENKSLSESSTLAIINAENEKLRLQKSYNLALANELEKQAKTVQAEVEKSSLLEKANTLRREATVLEAKMTTEVEAQSIVAKNRLTVIQEQQKYETAILDVYKKRAQYAKQARDNVLALARAQTELKAAKEGREVNYAEQIALNEAERVATIKNAEEQYDIKVEEINLEYALLDAKFALLEAELKVAEESGKIAKNTYDSISNALTTARGSLKTQKGTALNTENQTKNVAISTANATADTKNIEAERKQQQQAIALIEAQAAAYETAGNKRLALATEEKAIIAEQALLVNDASLEGQKRLAELSDALAQIAQERRALATESVARTAGEQAGAFASGNEILANKQATLESPETLGSEKIAIFSQSVKQLNEQLAALGPEGTLVASVVSGAFAIGEAWANVGEVLQNSANSMERGAAIAQAVGATLNSINNIMNAASEARIASIDKEIAAEKKRDGKSAQSLAKIAALEKKKEKEKRKQFETDKKMKMATTVANTAMAIMQALAQGGLYAIPIAAMFAVMGAAQLAVIASTSYDGGGAAAPSGPSAISLGERGNTVDLAKSKSASGELGYMRGESGMGGINEFRPAFTGVRHRATGGATTGYVVGEQGPELFIPNTPGTVVPNDALQTAPTQNVNFSIQAVDAAGVEELLIKQRGSIIRMIRDAANSYGSPFLEEVNVGVYTPQAQGASRA